MAAAVQAGQTAAYIGSLVIEFAINKAINRIPFGRFIPGWARGYVQRGVMRGLRGIGLSPEVIGSRIQRRLGCNAGSSFAGSTQVQTQTGRKRLDTMLLGEMVLSKNEITGELAYKNVTAQHVSDYTERYEVTIRDIETGDLQILKASHNHPFFARLPENAPMAVGAEGLVYQGPIEWGHWVDTLDLKPGYALLNEDETWAEVVSVEKVTADLTAYNLTVAEFHTFYVAANTNAAPVWVHNCAARNPVSKYEVGQANTLRNRSVSGDGLDIHHAGQAHALEQVIPGYNRATGPAIALLRNVHSQLPRRSGLVSETPRNILAQDIRDLRNKTAAPNSSLQRLIDQNKVQYPGALAK